MHKKGASAKADALFVHAKIQQKALRLLLEGCEERAAGRLFHIY